MKQKLQNLVESSKKNIMLSRPLFFRLSNNDDKRKFEELINDNQHVEVYDELENQLEELIKSTNPKVRFSKEQLSKAVREHIGNKPNEEYGVWVFYPWISKLVHILDEDEFIEVRTSRNQYKITKEEREKLSKLKVGVVGLSVGQSVSVTMAMERGFGEIRLADFDLLELTNLNRIRTGVHNLNIPKAIAVAREIAEIDPFLKTTCYIDGLTKDNMNDFFSKGGDLDILIDECDSLDIKILARQKAKSMRIPVVMDMSDRGTLDVERFDLEPDRPLLHGMIDHLDVDEIGGDLTNEQKIPFLLAMIGIDTLSTRLKASMVEVGQTVTTWPQLASAVALGGALCADVCRRIALDQYHQSGRYFVDIEEQIGDPKKIFDPTQFGSFPELTSDEVDVMINSYGGVSSSIIDKDKLTTIVEAATLAPTGGNNQPWKWVFKNNTLHLFHEKSITYSFGDFNDMVSHIGLGAALENLVLKSHEIGLEVQIDEFPYKEDLRYVAAINFINSDENAQSHDADELVDAIVYRNTNRKVVEREIIKQETLQFIEESVKTMPCAEFHIIDDEQNLEEIADICAKVERLRFMHPWGHYDFYNKEMRWSKKEAEETKDGLDIRTLELSPSDEAGLLVAKDPSVIEMLNTIGGGKAFENISKKAVATSSAVCLVTMPEFVPKDILNGGRAMQRAWLAANKKGLSFHPVSSPIFFFAKMIHGNRDDMPKHMVDELKELRDRFVKIMPITKNKGEVFLFRLAKAGEPSVRSLRKPVTDVLSFIN